MTKTTKTTKQVREARDRENLRVAIKALRAIKLPDDHPHAFARDGVITILEGMDLTR